MRLQNVHIYNQFCVFVCTHKCKQECTFLGVHFVGILAYIRVCLRGKVKGQQQVSSSTTVHFNFREADSP